MTASFRPFAVLSLVIVATLLWYFHNRFWWPVDEGVYAYVAQRMLAGDRLHLDIIDLHAGYGNLINMWAFRLFGEDLLSLRYPLVAATLGQSAIVLWLLRERGALVAGVASIAVGCFSFIQFMNPSANWYALALCFAAIGALAWFDPRHFRNLVLIGALLGLCFFTRQLSGIILAMGAITWLLLALPQNPEGRGIAAKALLVIMALGLLGYLSTKSSLVALVIFGAWPLAILVLAIIRTRAVEGDVLRLVGGLIVGGLLAAAPLIIHHAIEGALGAWLYDMFVTALLIHGQDFIKQASFGTIFQVAGVNAITLETPTAVVNGLFWMATIATVPLVGALTVRRVAASREVIHPLPIIAAFWAVTAIHYQIPVYLTYAVPVCFAALLWMIPRPAVVGAALALSAVAVVFHAGQPLSRGLIGIVEGKRVALDAEGGLPRVSLKMEKSDRTLYRHLLDTIERGAGANEPLMTIPMNPELNFIANRPSPMRYYGTPLGLISKRDVLDSVLRLKAAAPLYVVHRRQDKYLTPLSAELLSEVRLLSLPPTPIGPFDLYRLPGRQATR